MADVLEVIYVDVVARDQGVTNDLNRISSQAQSANRSQARSVTDLDGRIKNLSQSIASVRSSYVAGFRSEKQFREETSRLKNEIGELTKTERLNVRQTLALNRAAATAERGLATVRGEASKLGLAQQVVISRGQRAVATLSQFGPAGNIAAAGLRPVSGLMVALIPAAFLAGSALAIRRLKQLADAGTEIADPIQKGAAATGLSIEAFQELSFALDQNGLSREQFVKGLANFNDRVGESIQGNQEYAATFDQLGVKFRDNEGTLKDTEQLFTETFEALSKLPNAFEQTQAASDLFGGRVAKDLLPALEGGVDGLAALRREAREAGLVISGEAVLSLVAYKDEMAVLERQIETAKIEITAGFLPVLRDGVIPLIQNLLVPLLQSGADKLTNLYDRFVDTSVAGATFRTSIAGNLAPLVQMVALLEQLATRLQIVGNQIEISSIQASESLANRFGVDVNRTLQQLGLPAEFADRVAPLDSGQAQARISQLQGQQNALFSDLSSAEDLFVNAENYTVDFLSNLVDTLNTEIAPPLRGVGESLGEELGSGIADGVGRTVSSRTVTDVFSDLERTGTLAAQRAFALDNTVEAQLISAKQRASALGKALDEALELGASEAQLEFLKTRIGEVDEEIRQLTPIKLELPEVTARTAAAVPIDGSVYNPSTGKYESVVEVSATTAQPVQIGGTRYNPSTGEYEAVLNVQVGITGAGRIALAQNRLSAAQQTQSRANLPAAAQLGAGLPNPTDPYGLAGRYAELGQQVQARVRAEQEAADAQEAGAKVVRGVFFRAGIALEQGVDTLAKAAQEAERRRLLAQRQAEAAVARRTAQRDALAEVRFGSPDAQNAYTRQLLQRGLPGNGAGLSSSATVAALRDQGVSTEQIDEAFDGLATNVDSAAANFESTVISSAVSFAATLSRGIQTGDTGSIVQGAVGAAGSILSAVPGVGTIAGAAIGLGSQILGPLLGGLFGGGDSVARRREELERQRSNVSSINFNFAVTQQIDLPEAQIDSPANLQAISRIAEKVFESFYTRTIGPELENIKEKLP